MKQPTILWIDDKIANYQPFVDGLNESGLNVIAYDSYEKGIDYLNQNFEVSLFLIDLRMPDKSGFEVISIFSKMSPQTPICVLSSYLHLNEYVKKINNIKNAICVLDKEIPSPGTDAFVIFVDKIKSIIKDPPKYNPIEFAKKIGEYKVDPFDVKFKLYLNLPSSIKKIYRRQAEEQARKILDEEFKDGKIWVLLCGSATEPIMTASSEAEIPSSDQIMQKAFEIGKAPYQFSAPDSVDDFGSGACKGGSTEKSYPTLTIQFNGGKGFNFHFDTGCPFTVLSYEEINELGIVEAGSMVTVGERGRSKYDYISEKLTVKLVDQVNGNTKITQFKTRLVKDWLESPFVAYCPPFCEHYQDGKKKNCIYRKGLVGRNLLSETELSITINGKNNKTSFYKSK